MKEASGTELNRQFLSTVFLCCGFKLDDIYSGGKLFAVIFICGNLFLRIAGKIAKILCHAVCKTKRQIDIG